MAVERTLRPLLHRCAAARMAADVAVALGARAIEDRLAGRLQGSQHGIGVRQRACSSRYGVRQGLHAQGGELRLLEGRQVVQEARRGIGRCPRMATQRCERLVLQRVDAAVELVTAALVRPSRRRGSYAIGASDADVKDRRGRSPDIGDGLAGRERRCRARDRRAAVEELYVRGQRDRDANKAELRQVREVVRRGAVDAEVIGVDRAEQRIVDARHGHLRKPCLRGRRGQLEVLGIHVAVGTRPAIATQARERPVVEVRLASTERGVDRRLRRSRGAGVGIDGRKRARCRPGRHRHMRRERCSRTVRALQLNWLPRGFGFTFALRDAT